MRKHWRTLPQRQIFVCATLKRATLGDAVSALKEGDDKSASILLSPVSNILDTIEDMHRNRGLFLNLTSDPKSSVTERDYANNVLRKVLLP
jgi:hypothetical protein